MANISDSRFLVVAAEPSGSAAAAGVVDALGAAGGASFFGLGCRDLAQRGVDLVADVEEIVAMGLGDVVGKLGSWCDVWSRLRRRVEDTPPAAALLVDSPDLNLPLARVLKERGIPVLQYIGPQVWAWRKHRLRTLGRRVDHTAVVFRFEKDMYERAGISSDFVGHPILDLPPPVPVQEVKSLLHAPLSSPVVALLPGSRKGEIVRNSPAMLEAGIRLLKEGMVPVFAPAPGVDRDLLLHARGCGCQLLPRELTARDLLGACDGALVSSGTATLEAMLFDKPMVITYRMGRLSFELARRMVKVRHVGLPNVLAGMGVVPEILQDEATGENLARVLREEMTPRRVKERKPGFLRARGNLGEPGAGVKVAGLLAKMATAR